MYARPDVWPWKPIFWCFWQIVLVLILHPEAVFSSVVRNVTKDKQFSHAMHFNTQSLYSVSLCGLPLMAKLLFLLDSTSLTVITLIVDLGTFNGAECSWTDLWKRSHPVTVRYLRSLSSFVWPIWLLWLLLLPEWLCAWFYAIVPGMPTSFWTFCILFP